MKLFRALVTSDLAISCPFNFMEEVTFCTKNTNMTEVFLFHRSVF